MSLANPMRVVNKFRAHVASVEKLMKFDRDVLDLAIGNLRELREKLVRHHKLDNPQLTAERVIQILERIRMNDSLRPRYETIFNQALVLLVSYFGSSAQDLFRRGVREALASQADSQLLRENLRITLRELRDANFDLRDLAPDLLVQSKDISFQDMQSIARAFKDYLDIKIEKNAVVNDIILGQACRHVIVHSGGVADDRLLRQVADATPRNVKVALSLGEVVQFSDLEVTSVAQSMMKYIEGTAQALRAKFGVEM